MSEMKDFKCPNCGGNIEFDSKTQGMKCPYCDSEFDMQAMIALDNEMAFNKVPVDGSSSMPDDLMESLEPYDYSGLKPFATPYLAGYIADRYDVTMVGEIAPKMNP